MVNKNLFDYRLGRFRRKVIRIASGYFLGKHENKK